MQFVLATHNKGKITEMQHALSTTPHVFTSQAALNIPSPEETGLSFVENALLKARFVAQQSGLPSIADDSGLVVPALGGAPGLYSARFAGPLASDAENVAHLLECLSNKSDRRAFFYCVIVLLRHTTDPTPYICEGRWEGEITLKPTGTSGFGYDPVFWIPTQQCTAAQLPLHEKNAYSHRGQALKKLAITLDTMRDLCRPND